MGLSVVISGAIMMVALMFVLYSIPTLLTSITSVGDTSTEISNLENSILQTEIGLDSMVVNSSMPSFTFNLNNINIEKLWNYENFDVLVTYDADVAGTKTRITETIPFNALNQSYTILDEIVSTSADATANGAYTVLNDMTTTVPVESTDSVILFHANITYDDDNGGSDAACRTGLFIDAALVAEAEDTVNVSTTEPGNVGLTWWATGLAAGNHVFDVRWLEEGGQTGCIPAPDTERSMQVIEFIPGDGVPTIITELKSSSAESYTTVNQPVNGMKDSPFIASPESLVLTTTTVTFDEDGGGDASCFLGIYIDGTLQAEQQTFTNSLDLPGSVGLMWAETGLSTGSHTIDLLSREGQTGCGTDSTLQRHMQVVEYTSGNPTILAEEITTGPQTMTPAYVLITTLIDTVPIDGPGSVVLFTATVTFDAGVFNTAADVGLFIDGTMVAEGGVEAQDNVPDEPGHVNLHWWETGLSEGMHTFEVRGKDNDNPLVEPGADIDTATISHMQVVEFPCTTQWNVANISNDVLDPGILNPEETANISVELCNPIFSNGNVIVSVSTDNGVTASLSGIAT